MSVIERIVERLRKYLHVTYQVSGHTVVVLPVDCNGVQVALTEGVGEFVINFDGWHEHFTSETDALNCFAFGLSDRCRLRIHMRGDFPYRWTVQVRTPSGWQDDSTTALLFFPCWRRLRIEYRQNTCVTDSQLISPHADS